MPRTLGVVRAIEIEKIEPNKNQPRKFFDEEGIKELAESIRTCGIIQPITLKDMGEDRYQIISGERRFRAAKEVGLSAVPSIIAGTESQTNDFISLIENIQREDLNFAEEARAYKKMIDEYGMTQGELAKKVGKTQSAISNLIRLLSLEEEVLDIIIDNNLTQRHARALLSLKGTELRIEAANEIASKDLSVKASELLIKRMVEEEQKSSTDKQTVKNIFNYKIYTNTIKRACDDILQTGAECDYKENVYDDRVEVVITIPTSK